MDNRWLKNERRILFGILIVLSVPLFVLVSPILAVGWLVGWVAEKSGFGDSDENTITRNSEKLSKLARRMPPPPPAPPRK